MISIICACNDDAVFDRMLMSSLKKQTYTDYEVIKLDSVALGLKGAANTLNYGADIANGDILVFIHQDIELSDRYCLQKINEYAVALKFGIAGVAGVKTGDKSVYSSVTMDVDHRQAGLRITEVKEAEVLDECLLIVRKADFKGFRDYNSWHFYAVEYSLRCLRQDEKVLVLPLDVYHLSPGWSLNDSYWDTLKRVAKDFKDFKVIPTTMGQYNNNSLLSLEILLRKLRAKIKNKS